jgi:hypothetical protein
MENSTKTASSTIMTQNHTNNNQGLEGMNQGLEGMNQGLEGMKKKAMKRKDGNVTIKIQNQKDQK